MPWFNPSLLLATIANAESAPEAADTRKSAKRTVDRDLQFRQLVLGVKDYAIFMLDPEGIIATWNPGAERIKGYRAEEVIGRHFSIFYPEESLARDWPRHELEAARAAGPLRGRGLAPAQGRLAVLGQRGDHRAPRRGRTVERVRQGHARPDRAAAERGGAAGRARRSRAPRGRAHRRADHDQRVLCAARSRAAPSSKRSCASSASSWPNRWVSWPRPIGSRTSSSPCWRTSCATPWRRSPTASRS